MKERCPSCFGHDTYPMLVDGGVNEARKLCANTFHSKWYDFALHPTLWKLIKRWWEGW